MARYPHGSHIHAPSALPRRGPRAVTRAAAAFTFAGLLALILFLPHGEMSPRQDADEPPGTGGKRLVDSEGAQRTLRTLGSITGQLSAMVLLASLALGRDWPIMRRMSPARRVRLHARLGKVVLALAAVHTLLLVVNFDFRGWIPGTLALAAFIIHGLTHALRARLICAWGPGWWRYAHRMSAWSALLLSVEHIVMASWHWGFARHFELTGWGH